MQNTNDCMQLVWINFGDGQSQNEGQSQSKGNVFIQLSKT